MIPKGQIYRYIFLDLFPINLYKKYHKQAILYQFKRDLLIRKISTLHAVNHVSNSVYIAYGIESTDDDTLFYISDHTWLRV